ncbi:Putative F-box domain-containing protein [Septoria linicola]|uniref:F-box domain-containing protein n=1 Tax=Septoria linicola TaxID=215465 RepID=A0A9Q9B249_9PEZI|nr:putative F-box domain-containing protein [Septoria linicola]USW59554.1 Putative F-box domain-containing protein [Septoria linicola]
MPASMLQLPRELYLECCAYLTPTDLTKLSRVSRDHYLAVQESLYGHVGITTFPQLVNLVRTVGRAPIVSCISAEQRLHWHKLSDAQLRERDIRRLDIILNSTNKHGKISGEHFSRCIGAISRRGNGVKISLTLYGNWHDLLTQLRSSSLPDVRRFELCVSTDVEGLWDQCFGGSTFPDLLEVDLDTSHTHPDQREGTLYLASRGRGGMTRSHFQFTTKKDEFMPFYGLKKMTSIKIRDVRSLREPVLQSLFGSAIIPQRLTKVEISFCSGLDQLKSLTGLSVLLQRGLQLLQHLKLHLGRMNVNPDEPTETRYCHAINEHPEQHLCNIVRELGQNIKILDLALPFACSHMLKPLPKKPRSRHSDYPTIPREPLSTLRERLLAEGYKYRRLIVWNGVCRSGHDWEEMQSIADDQGDMISWEITNREQRCASWHVSGCLPMKYKSSEVLKRQLEDWEK